MHEPIGDSPAGLDRHRSVREGHGPTGLPVGVVVVAADPCGGARGCPGRSSAAGRQVVGEGLVGQVEARPQDGVVPGGVGRAVGEVQAAGPVEVRGAVLAAQGGVQGAGGGPDQRDEVAQGEIGGPAAADVPGAAASVGPALAAPQTSPAPVSRTVAAAPSVVNPGNQVSLQYDHASLPMTATGGAAPYTWSAVNLPAGASINASTGLISGLLRGSGIRTVTVTATDAKGAAASTTFTWRVIRDACPRC
ncbi:putative Ig domain-containing protein [Streptomyces sp. NPDC048257]|uniref:putative Ig domain-containing protein n=1 Tax=Streptomyces sp. NPDC048257 TaxID=3365526 RepID=UPI00371D7E26